MAHMTLVVPTKNLDMEGNKLTQAAIDDLAQRLRDKFGTGSVKLKQGALKISLTKASCVCGKRDRWGPEHEQWCPLWYDREIEIDEDEQA